MLTDQIVKLLQDFSSKWSGRSWILFSGKVITIVIKHEHINCFTGEKWGPALKDETTYIWRNGQKKKIKMKQPWYSVDALKLCDELVAIGCKDFDLYY